MSAHLLLSHGLDLGNKEHWPELGKRILKGARVVQAEPKLRGLVELESSLIPQQGFPITHVISTQVKRKMFQPQCLGSEIKKNKC